MAERGKEPPPLDFLAQHFDEKGAAAALTNKRVDVGQEVFWEEDVGAFVAHG